MSLPRFALPVMVLLLVGTNRGTIAAETFWAGQSAGFIVEWSDENLSARTAGGEVLFSVRAEAASDAAATGARELKVQTAPCQFRQQLRLLSLVGPFLSIEERNYRSCEGWLHPASEARFRTTDLRRLVGAPHAGRSESHTSLTEFFSASGIAKALRENSLIRRSVDGELPRDLPSLLTTLSIAAHPPEEMCFSLPTDLMSRFAFYDVNNGQVTMRLGLPGLGPCRAKLTDVTLKLPLQPGQRRMLMDAKSRLAGILMVDTERLFGQFQTIISIDYRDAP